jgi:hypothetical protein
MSTKDTAPRIADSNHLNLAVYFLDNEQCETLTFLHLALGIGL